MDIEVAKRLIKQYETGHAFFAADAEISERYYRNRNDILQKHRKEDEEQDNGATPLRNADNRISHNFHGLLVNQKAAYMFTAPPLFDVGSSVVNKKIAEILGDKYAKVCKDLCINASNSNIAWIHYWIDENTKFKYAVVDSKQVIPVWSDDLEKELLAVMRKFTKIDDDGSTVIIYEIWTKEECQAFCMDTNAILSEGLLYYEMFYTLVEDTRTMEMRSYYKHGFGRVPFIPFKNNNVAAGDLENIKGLIDTYDAVFSGFVNDLEDIQQIIFVLSGYQGTDLGAFLSDLKKYKTVKLDDDENGNPGLTTLNIEIPVEAREKLLTITRKEIFEQGQGVDPQPEQFGNKSGEALKFMYALLELKAGLMETEFRLGFGELVRAICQYLNIECKKIIQTWTRTSIKNDTEQATICKDSIGIVSNHTLLLNHPFVENADEEEKQLEKERENAKEEQADMFGNAFTQNNNDEQENDNNDEDVNE